MKRRIRKNHKTILILGPLAIITLCVALVWIKIQTNSEKNFVPKESEKIEIPKSVSATSRILFAGTTFWGRRTNTASRNSELGVEYPFEKLDTLEREKYQAWIGNLECPITENDHTKYEEETLLIFNCHTDYLDEVAKYFTAFSLGTNHADNWEEEGIKETKKNLDSVGIQYFGHYRYDNDTENCGIVVVPVEVELENGQTVERSIPLGLCSAHGVFGVPTASALDNIAHYAEVLPTIVMPHMGVEYESQADELRTNLFRKMIDYGADMVLADHPHWIQNSESYDGHLIVYSMGNFMFDQQAVETNRSAAIDVTANIDKDTDFDAWEELSSICLEKKGDCLEEIIAKDLPRLDIKWENYDFVATINTNYQTQLADETERARISQRLNWPTTLSNLNAN